MTAGVAMARQNTKTSGWIPFRFPQRIQMLSRSRAERALLLNIGSKIKRKSHISAVRASKEIIPYLKVIFKNNTKMAAGLAKWLELNPEMIKQLVGSEEKAEAIITLMS
jgi:replication factor C large subunit